MTMYSLPNFCRVCLKYEKNLIDLAHIENEPSETLMSKLEQCVSEVEWNSFKPLLCHPCIKRLNIAYTFKRQCMQSATVLKSYVELLKDTQKKNESHTSTLDAQPAPGAFMVLPNQKFLKIVVGGPQQQNTSFQNVFLNLIPTGTTAGNLNASTTIAPVTINPVPVKDNNTSKDNNQNVFVSLNNTMQKFVPIAPSKPKPANTPVINQLLTDTKTEELSVEIDPTIFGLGGSDSESSGPEEEANDWDEVISQSQINSKMNGDKGKGKKGSQFGNYVPILPKDDFFTSGQHFLFPDSQEEEAPPGDKNFRCETCQKNYANVKILKNHIKMFHMGKYPFKCEFCTAEYVTRVDYELCVNSHKTCNENDDSITLKDFANTSMSQQSSQSNSDGESNCAPGPGEEGMIFPCELCKRQFNSSTGLLRHKVRKHNQKNKKKYFIKGMKNARCDICNREFSTQSYMQLHRKLHLRDDVGYKYKVFGKSKYVDKGDKQKVKEEVKSEAENIDVTPDITLERETEEDSDSDGGSSPKELRDRLENLAAEVEITRIVKPKEEKAEDSNDENSVKMEVDENPSKMDIDESSGESTQREDTNNCEDDTSVQ